MKKITVLILCLMIFKGINAQQPKEDVNTLLICIDEENYNQLFENPFIKDSIFICRDLSAKTDKESYSGKYFIGNSATIEFFKPKKSNDFGDKLNDIGIEFKTRKNNDLKILQKSGKQKQITFKSDTIYNNNLDETIPWYYTLERKTDNLNVSVLEYHPNYLKELGFTDAEINREMSYADFNQKISGGKKYPKKFSNISSISVTLHPKAMKNLLKTFQLLDIKKINANTYQLGYFIINFNIKKAFNYIRLDKIGIELMEPMPDRKEKISEKILFTSHQQKAEIVFNHEKTNQ